VVQVINQTVLGAARETPDYRLVSDKSFYGTINDDCLLVEEAVVMVSFLSLPPSPIICPSHSSLVRYCTSLQSLLFDLYFIFFTMHRSKGKVEYLYSSFMLHTLPSSITTRIHVLINIRWILVRV
jgi:hypothetical protein